MPRRFSGWTCNGARLCSSRWRRIATSPLHQPAARCRPAIPDPGPAAETVRVLNGRPFHAEACGRRIAMFASRRAKVVSVSALVAYALDNANGTWWEPAEDDARPSLTIDLGSTTQFADEQL